MEREMLGMKSVSENEHYGLGSIQRLNIFYWRLRRGNYLGISFCLFFFLILSSLIFLQSFPSSFFLFTIFTPFPPSSLYFPSIIILHSFPSFSFPLYNFYLFLFPLLPFLLKSLSLPPSPSLFLPSAFLLPLSIFIIFTPFSFLSSLSFPIYLRFFFALFIFLAYTLLLTSFSPLFLSLSPSLLSHSSFSRLFAIHFPLILSLFTTFNPLLLSFIFYSNLCPFPLLSPLSSFSVFPFAFSHPLSRPIIFTPTKLFVSFFPDLYLFLLLPFLSLTFLAFVLPLSLSTIFISSTPLFSTFLNLYSLPSLSLLSFHLSLAFLSFFLFPNKQSLHFPSFLLFLPKSLLLPSLSFFLHLSSAAHCCVVMERNFLNAKIFYVCVRLWEAVRFFCDNASSTQTLRGFRSVHGRWVGGDLYSWGAMFRKNRKTYSYRWAGFSRGSMVCRWRRR